LKLKLKIKIKGIMAMACASCPDQNIYGIMASKSDHSFISHGFCTPHFREFKEALKKQIIIKEYYIFQN